MLGSGVTSKVVILAMEYRGFGRSDDAEMSEESFVPWFLKVYYESGEVYFQCIYTDQYTLW